MKLLTKHLKRTLPPLYATENDGDSTVWVKFFNPTGRGTWLVTEASVVRDDQHLPLKEHREGDEVLLFGYAELVPGGGELGYTALSQLQSVEGPLGLGIERDRHFEPCPLSEAKKRAGL